MNTKRVLIILIISILAIFLFKNFALRLITKNWEKESLFYETKDFKIEMATNLSKGCVKTGIDFYHDTIIIYNYKLNDILLFLTQKNINSSEFINPENSPKKRFNFSYYSKDSIGNYKLHKNEILDKLCGEFNFKYNYDSVQLQKYVTRLVDKEKLEQKQVNENDGKYRLGKDYAEFMGNDLDGVFRAFNFSVKGQVFENNIKDSKYYSFKVPSLKRDKILMYFDDKLGIEFDERKVMTERLIVNFE